MFDQSDPDARLRRTPATLLLRSGEVQQGEVLVPMHRTLREELNDPAPFMEVELASGGRGFFSKAAIDRVEPAAPGAKRAKGARTRMSDELPREGQPSRFEAEDPHAVLGLTPDAGTAEARVAYLNLAKSYHPDRLSALGLPPELVAHAGRVFARINVAYKTLTGEAA